jgi:hypothetical protein
VKDWEHVGAVASESAADVWHTIKRNRSTGQIGCSCMAWRFSKGRKACKHTAAFEAGEVFHHIDGNPRNNRIENLARVPLRQPAPERKVQVDAETFTVRRGMSFGGVPGGAA